MIEVLHFYISSFTVIMSCCIAFDGILFYLMFGTRMLCSFRWFIACSISSSPKLSNKISAWEDHFQYLQFKWRCDTYGVCESGPGHFASEQSFP